MSENPKNVSFEVLCFFWFAKFCSYLYIRRKTIFMGYETILIIFTHYALVEKSRSTGLKIITSNFDLLFTFSVEKFVLLSFFVASQGRNWRVSNFQKLWWKNDRTTSSLSSLTHIVFENHRKKVAFHIASEASYVYILSGEKFIKMPKKGPFWRIFENLKKWLNSVTRHVCLNKTKIDTNCQH